MTATVIVPLDGSDESARSLPVAARLAADGTLAVRVLHISVPGPVVDRKRLETQVLAAGLDPHRTDIVVERTVRSVPDAIVAAARDESDPMVCLASTGRGRSGAAAGTTAAEVVGQLDAPVIAVGPEVVPHDSVGPVLIAIDPDSVRADVIPSARRVAHLLHTSAETVRLLVPEDSALVADRLVERAMRDDACMMALTTRSMRLPSASLAESVSLRVLHRAPCPVLIVRSGALVSAGASS